MITQHAESQCAVFDRKYSVEVRGNTPFLVLASVEFVCRVCDKGAYIDLTEVPVHRVHVKCGGCDTPLFFIPEEDFEHELEIVKEKSVWE